MTTKKEIKEATEKVIADIFDPGYVNRLPKEYSEKCKPNFLHYLTDGVQDGSGAFYPFMTEVCAILKPKHVVELGNREGLGVVSIFHGLKDSPDSVFTSIDIVNDLRYVPASVKIDPKVNLVFGDVLDKDVIAQVKDTGPIDMIFLDTVHTEEQLEAEWNLYEPLLSDTALVLVDDIYYDTKHKFFDKIKHDKFADRRLHSSGFGVVFYERS